MSEVVSTSETQTVKLQEVLDFINRPDEEIVNSGYREGILRTRKNLLYNSDDPTQTTRYEQIKAQLQKSGVFIAEISFEEVPQNPDGLSHQIARILEVPGSSGFRGYGLSEIIIDYLKKLQEKELLVALFFRNVTDLSMECQTRLRGLLDHVSGEPNIRIFALGSRREFDRQLEKWVSSPLLNVLFPESEWDQIPRFDLSRGEKTIDAFRGALNQLKNRDSAVVALPSKSGKTSFALFLNDFLQEEIRLVNLEEYIGEGQTVDIEKLPLSPERNIVLVDEAQLLTEDQKVALTERYGKVVFIENTDVTQKAA